MHLVQQATLGGEPRSTYQAVTLIRAVTGAVTGADLSWWDRTIFQAIQAIRKAGAHDAQLFRISLKIRGRGLLRDPVISLGTQCLAHALSYGLAQFGSWRTSTELRKVHRLSPRAVETVKLDPSTDLGNRWMMPGH